MLFYVAQMHEIAHLIYIHLKLKITVLPMQIPIFIHDTLGFLLLDIIVVSRNVPAWFVKERYCPQELHTEKTS